MTWGHLARHLQSHEPPIEPTDDLKVEIREATQRLIEQHAPLNVRIVSAHLCLDQRRVGGMPLI